MDHEQYDKIIKLMKADEGEKVRVAIYARVSTGLQEREETVQSQLEALHYYAGEKGYQVVHEYVDEGYSGATLARPGLDQLRDILEEGLFEIILVHSPDRLARNMGHQCVILDEFDRQGVKAEFLNHATDDTPEGRLLLQIQGIIAEYERAKIAERTRRGKLYWAKQGAMLGGYVPYGYRYVPKDGNLRSHLEIDENNASTVRQMYGWLIGEALSCRKIAARLNELHIPTAKGLNIWREGTVGRILKSEVYCGTLYYHREEVIESPGYHDRQGHRKNTKRIRRIRPKEEWVPVPVPSIIDRSTWEQAQEQLHQNLLHSPRNTKRQNYLLSGLVRCGICGTSCVGAAFHGHRYYRCGNHTPLPGQKGNSQTHSVQADPLEEIVWQAVAGVLQQPDVLAQEYKRRLTKAEAPNNLETERRQISLALRRIKMQEDRLIDAYKNEVIELDQLKVKIGGLKAHKQEIEQRQEALEQQNREQISLEEGLARLENFRGQVGQGLDNLTFEEKQKLLRLVVERITLEGEKVYIYAVVPVDSPSSLANLRLRGIAPQMNLRR